MQNKHLALLLLLLAGNGAAAVRDSGPGGFTIVITLDVSAAPSDVYGKLVNNVGDWWNPEHTFSGSAHNLTIDAKPAGCFCENFPKGGGVRHMEVVYAAPGKTLRMSGALGPLQGLGASGALTIDLAAAGSGTKISVTYAVGGYGVEKIAGPADGMLTEQFTRLKKYVETGKP